MQPEDTKPDEVTTDETVAEASDTQEAQPEPLTPEQIQEHAQKFAEGLGETDGKPIGQIGLLIEKCGLDFVKKLAEETDKVEAKDGIKTHDGKRRRTKGGVFFFLAKGRMDPKIRQEIFPNFGKHADGNITPIGIEWTARKEYIKPLAEEPGQVNNLDIKLIGRLGKVHIEGGTVMTVVEQKQVKSPPYPKGVPPFEDVEEITYYYVFMSLKHWQTVEESLKDETDMIIVEGTAVFDTELNGISILSTRVTTKLLERQKRLNAAQKSKEKGKKGKAKAKQDDGEKSQTQPKSPAKTTSVSDLGNVPQSVADKLKQLHSAADTLRQKITTMEADGKTSGLNMTHRLLEQTEKQIATLESQYKK